MKLALCPKGRHDAAAGEDSPAADTAEADMAVAIASNKNQKGPFQVLFDFCFKQIILFFMVSWLIILFAFIGALGARRRESERIRQTSG